MWKEDFLQTISTLSNSIHLSYYKKDLHSYDNKTDFRPALESAWNPEGPSRKV